MEQTSTHGECKFCAERPSLGEIDDGGAVCLVYVERVEPTEGATIPGGERACPFYCWKVPVGSAPASKLISMECEDYSLEGGEIVLTDGDIDGKRYPTPIEGCTSARYALGCADGMYAGQRGKSSMIVNDKNGDPIYIREAL